MAGTAQAINRTNAPERRSRVRFPLVAAFEYVSRTNRRGMKTGRGVTVNLSGTGVLFEADQPLPLGGPLQFSIEWPAMLEGKVGLRLVGRGRVTRVEGNCIAVQLMHYEFRTRALKGQSSDTAESLPRP